MIHSSERYLILSLKLIGNKIQPIKQTLSYRCMLTRNVGSFWIAEWLIVCLY